MEKEELIRTRGIALFVCLVVALTLSPVNIFAKNTFNISDTNYPQKAPEGSGGASSSNSVSQSEIIKETGSVESSQEPTISQIENKPIVIDSKVPDRLLETIEIPVIIKVRDTSRISISSKDPIEIQSIKDFRRKEFLDNKTTFVLESLKTNEFHLKDRFILGNGFYGNITKEGLESLKNNPNVAGIFFDGVAHTTLDESRSLINADDVASAGYDGTHQAVCVIDTGIAYDHSDLGGCFGSTCKVRGGWNYDNDSGVPYDDDGHGTHVSGIIASEDSTYKGIAPNAKLVAMRVCDSSGENCQFSSITQSLQYCYTNRNIYNISAVSISLGDGGEYDTSDCPSTSEDEINDLYSVGIPVVVSSGNEGHTNGISWPACNGNATSVGAVYDANIGSQNWPSVPCTDSTTTSDKITCFTNRKSGVLDLLAPGCEITSTQPGGGFATECGTSQAAPHVSGAIALLKQLNKTLTVNQIETAFKNTGVTVSPYKRIDALAALNSIRDKDSDDYYDTAYGGNDCNDNQAGINPGATEVCDGVDNDCDSSIDEGCSGLQECTESGYEQCLESTYEDCDVSIAANYYENVNTIEWGAVNDANDPYVIGQYRVGWKAVDAEDMYYDVDDPNGGDCEYGGCDGTDIADTGTMVTTNAPATASTENILGYDDTASWACWVWFNGFNPNYGGSNPVYVLNCFDDGDCSGSQYCDKSGSWSTWSCVNKKTDGQSCTQDYQCLSGYCDNDGIGLSDDGWCFTPYSTYFDGQENTYCEYSTDNGIEDCDERQSGADLDKCLGISYYEEECSSSCTYQDATSVFECNETGCSCQEPSCDGVASGGSLANCSYGNTYFADKCNSTAGGEDRTDNICRSSGFASGCSADAACNGVAAGNSTSTGSCSLTCAFDGFPNVTLNIPLNNNVNQTADLLFNCSVTDDKSLINLSLYHNISGTWKSNGTQTLSGVSGSAMFELNGTPNGNYKWNCLAYDNASQPGWATLNYSIKVNVTQTISNLTISLLQAAFSNYSRQIFEFVIENNGNTRLDNVSWRFDTNNGNLINSTQNFTLESGETIFVFMDYNFTSTGEYTVIANASAINVSDSETLGVSISNESNVDIYDFSILDQNSTSVIFGFNVNNTGSANSTINWTLNTGAGAVSADSLAFLTPSESIFVFAAYNYSTTGEYHVTATATDGLTSDMESLYLDLQDIEVANLSILNTTQTTGIFEFIIENTLQINLTNISWTFDTKNGNVINSTYAIALEQGEDIFVFVQNNFSSSGAYNVNATATNGTLSDSKNLTIII